MKCKNPKCHREISVQSSRYRGGFCFPCSQKVLSTGNTSETFEDDDADAEEEEVEPDHRQEILDRRELRFWPQM